MTRYPEIGDFSPRSGVTFRVINPEIGDRQLGNWWPSPLRIREESDFWPGIE